METKLSPDGLRVEISDESFGFPEAGFPIQRSAQDPGPVGPNLRPFVCENGTYRLVSGIFELTQRGSSTEPRPLPYTPAFNRAFPRNITSPSAPAFGRNARAPAHPASLLLWTTRSRTRRRPTRACSPRRSESVRPKHGRAIDQDPVLHLTHPTCIGR